MIDKIRCCVALFTLLACFLLTLQPVFAAKPVREPEAPPVTIHSVIVDEANAVIVVNGVGLSGVSEVVLGGVDVFGAIDQESTDAQLLLVFDTNIADAVSGPGSYSLTLNGNSFSVYFSADIGDPTSDECPCTDIWDSYGSEISPDGFADLEPVCIFESESADQVAVQFYDLMYGNIWILTTEFNSSDRACALVIDEPTQPLSSYQQHEACSSYLRTNFFADPDLPSCF